MLVNLIESVYRLLWGDLFTIPLGGGIGISLMAVLLLTAGVFFTLRTRLLPVRLFRDMIAAVCEKNQSMDSLSSFQTLIVSTATRVGMGNLVGVVAAVSAGGAGAVFWMWVTALLGASTSFVESTLAQKYRQPDPLYGGQRGGPAYYIHVLAERKRGKKLRHSIIAVLFAISGLICWCGISQVISNSVSSAFANAFSIPPIVTTVVLVVLSAVIVLRKDATVKSLDVIVPIMAVCYFVMTVIIIVVNFRQLPAVLGRIFSEAFGLRQVAAGGFGAVLMNGVKRGLFSNEAGSGSAPCAAAAASCDDPVKMGFVQALGVLIDTVVICSCTAFMMLLAPANVTTGLTGMDLLQAAAQYHLGSFGVVFIAVTLALFSFSTFIGILYYARCNVAYLFGDSWFWQTAYKVLALVMLVVSIMTSTLTTRIKLQEQLRMESETEKMRANLLRAVSHDLRTPLTSIYGACSTVIENYDSLAKEQKLKLLGEVCSDAQWLNRMVENLLSVTRFDTGTVSVQKTPTVLEELIDTVLVRFQKHYPDVNVTVDLPDSFVVIPMDSMLISQVLMNLLENAVLHAEGMTRLTLRVFTLGDHAIFEVSDDGCGIPKERLKGLFTRMLPADDTASPGKHGMGIGLAVCAAIVKAHGGEIKAESRPGEGTTIRFWLETESTDESTDLEENI